jgi:hypothetical protein
VNAITTAEDPSDQAWDDYADAYTQQDPHQYQDYDTYDERDLRVFDSSQSALRLPLLLMLGDACRTLVLM